MKAILDLLKQDGSTSKTGMVYGAMCIVFVLGVLTIGTIFIILAIQGELTPEVAKQYIDVAKEPAQGTGLMSLLYNGERYVKGRGEAPPAPRAELEGDEEFEREREEIEDDEE